MEKTFFIIKPDGMKIMLEIYERIMEEGLTMTDMRDEYLTEEMLCKHYEHIKDKHFFKDVLTYMTSSNCIYGILEGENAVAKWRHILGDTDPRKANPNSLRGKYGRVKNNIIYNVGHGSDSLDAANREIDLWLS